jgi:hypothetical protein
MITRGLRRLANMARLAVVLSLPAAAAVAPPPALAQPAAEGQWSPVFKTPNVMIHASLLPSGKVVFWSRREAGENLDPQDCTPRIWDPEKGTGQDAFSETPKPGFNLFCSGHTLLADGRVFAVGGHISDFHGSQHATIYDPKANTWTRVDDTKGGRWYPTAVTLPDGGVLVSFGANEHGILNETQQVWKDGRWRDIVDFKAPPLYPRMHVVKDGRVFMSGPLALTQFLNTSGAGNWTFLAPGDFSKSSRKNGERQYAPSVMYDVGKIAYIGGGLGENGEPTNAVETLDLNSLGPVWRPTDPMQFKRRQHNATLLPDGTVLVTGGTQGKGFNNLTPGQPIRSAELWDPKTGHWKKLARASVDRCYHSVAVLLPDATVLSAGGGEYRPISGVDMENDPKDSHKDAQIFSPPYLFRGGARPDITSAPKEVTYGQTFTVGTSHPDQVGQVNWVRLSSVTHSFNMNQRINFLAFTAKMDAVSVTAPASAELCPPGHYMLFVIDKDGIPSVANIVQIH